MEELLRKFAKLNILDGQYAIYGSGPLAIRGIREAQDLDVIVKNSFYKKLIEKYPEKEKGKIEFKNDRIEIFPAWNSLMQDAEKAIDRAELIQGFRFIKLKDIMRWKQEMGREKDEKDIELIREYLNNDIRFH
jgi:hypothetical protein